jgi:hypothetical protein
MLVELLDRFVVEAQALGDSMDDIRIEHWPTKSLTQQRSELAASGAEFPADRDYSNFLNS